MQVSQTAFSKPLPQADSSRFPDSGAKQPIPFFTAVFGGRADGADSNELERVVELGYN